ncbi:MAG: excinuclease ABC subunit UvrA, partial [Coriobacteriales bacterium]|nr:excinuclease ABC subunit UvrA [Coriobacteriales bacterium]
MAQKSIVLKGARQHNLKNINLKIPRDKLIVFTGLSGSGKSSLAFDTIYAEGQRRYVESLSSYARQFLGRMEKPDIDSIDGLSPAVSIDQKTTNKNPRSTVGTVTEIYDFLRLLYARVGVAHCPVCGRIIEKQTITQVTDIVMQNAIGEKIMVLSPVVIGRKGEFVKLFEDLKKEGFSRIRVNGEIIEISEAQKLDKNFKHNIDVCIDRIAIKEKSKSRLYEAIETATTLAKGNVIVAKLKSASEIEEEHNYSLALACPDHDYSLDELAPRDFSFNAPYGACPDCLGLGFKNEINANLLIPNKNLSIPEGAIQGISATSNYYPQMFAALVKHCNDDIDLPWNKLKKKTKDAILYGLGREKIRIDYVTRDGRDTYWFTRWHGILRELMRKYDESTSDKTKAKLENYMTINACSTCKGARLKPEVLAVTINGKNIYEATQLCAKDALDFFKSLKLQGQDATIGNPIVKEIVERLQFMVDVGLEYLTLDRATGTLSGGEAQRIRLATQIGSALMGVLYILDEPSIGLHMRDNERLINTLKRLRDLGNTVIVVEHDEETIRSADYIVDIGPRAGVEGGKIVASGTLSQILKNKQSLTAAYLNKTKEIAVPKSRRKTKIGKITLKGAQENNLKNIDVSIDLGCFNVITGVSGSGKSSLVTDTLAPAISNELMHSKYKVGKYKTISGIHLIDKIINIDQSPIGRTPRSNPATYIGVWDDIRNLFASLPSSRAKG